MCNEQIFVGTSYSYPYSIYISHVARTQLLTIINLECKKQSSELRTSHDDIVEFK